MKSSLALLALLLTQAPAIALGAETYAIDPAGSQIKWEGRKKIVDSKHYGTITVKSGDFQLQGNQIKGGTLLIDMASIQDEDLTDETYNAKLVGHLKSSDFFDVENFPIAKFILKKASPKKGKNGTTHVINGLLTIKNETHPVSFPAVIDIRDGTVKGKAQFAIDRTKWKVRYGSDKFFKGLGDKIIHDEIKFDLDLTAKKG